MQLYDFVFYDRFIPVGGRRPPVLAHFPARGLIATRNQQLLTCVCSAGENPRSSCSGSLHQTLSEYLVRSKRLNTVSFHRSDINQRFARKKRGKFCFQSLKSFKSPPLRFAWCGNSAHKFRNRSFSFFIRSQHNRDSRRVRMID